VETELQRAKGGNKDQEDEIERHIANALSHASGRHIDLEMGKLFVCEHIPKHEEIVVIVLGVLCRVGGV
jgi:hypothetical protein